LLLQVFDCKFRRITLNRVELLLEGTIHPTQKPVKLYKWLLKNYAKPGDKILDTHGGSCSLAIACHIMGFSATIYEIDEDYFAAAVERYKRHIQQQTLFGWDEK
jgi:site-specific DNA-methyltransferase (adenine-specific)